MKNSVFSVLFSAASATLSSVVASLLLTTLFAICCNLWTVGDARAETYRCVKNGQTTFSEIPCPDGTSVPVQIRSSVVSAQDYQHAVEQHKKDQAALQKIETARQKEEAQREKAAQKLASQHQKQKAKCDDLQLKVKWAREDLTQSSPKSEAKARQKLKRAQEKLALTCPGY